LLLATQPAASPAYDFAPMDDDISGNYYADVRDTCCNLLAQTEVVMVEHPPSIAIGGPCFLCNSDENDLPSTLTALPTGVAVGEVSLEWFVDGTPIGMPNAAELEIFDDTGDVYTLQMTTANGCVYTASFTPYKRCFVVGVDDLERVSAQVFPNPATDQLFIETEEPVRFREITLYDALGRPVKTAASTGLMSRTAVSLEGLPRGLYILQAFTEGGALLAREVIKE
ncbi:MAG: T9SS type A sorting domain-containing protein, partial [Lewinella sp.]